MKKLVLLSLVAMLAFSGAAFAQKVASVDRPADIPTFFGYVPDECIIVLKDHAAGLTPGMTATGVVVTGIPGLDAIAEKYSITGLRKQFSGSSDQPGAPTWALSRYYKVQFIDGKLDDVIAAYRQHPLIDHVEPIGIHRVMATPNDGFFSDQWHLDQPSDHDVDGPEAWDYETGDPSVIVAILDTGIRYFHKDLGGSNASYANPQGADGNMWINWTEKNGSPGVDDDGNGYIDDWVGYDFVDGATQCWTGEDCNVKDNDPRDFNGHGTHCAGNVAAINNNGYATCAPSGGWGNGTLQPTANGVKAMACRIGWSGIYIMWEVGYVRMDFAAEAFYYAADNGAKIASCSWGSSNSGGIAAAIDYFLANGGMIFHAAGNDGTQTADYMGSRTDIINVAATDSNDCKADFSTYGSWVDISAPGTGIMSLYHSHDDPTNDYVATMDGTSMATPLAASVAALIWSQNLGWTPAQVQQKLYDSADDIYGLACNSGYAGLLGAGRINAFNAVYSGTPPPVAEFSGSPTSGCAPLTVNFTDLSSGDITSWSWTFGDGGSSTDQNPTYIYNNPGVFTVSLTVTGPGGSDTNTKPGYITVNGAPVADFSGKPTGGTEPLTVTFTDLSTGNPTGWDWDFGDGVGTSTDQNPVYTYNNAGTYTVTLTATNACGSDVEVKTGYITVDPCVAPTADFSGTPTTGCAPLTVTFTDLSAGNPTAWDWDFGDGVGTSTDQNPVYTYNNAGTYTVTLTATNACGSDQAIKPGYIQVDSCGAQQVFALSDIPVAGTVSGNYTNTHASDDSYEVITEVLSTSHPVKIWSYLEHKWNFDVPAGGTIMFYVEAYRPDNADGDDFAFEYSTDNVNFVPLVTVASAVEQTYWAELPNTISGTVYVRVVDTDRNKGMTSLDPVYIDYMYIESGGEPPPPQTIFVYSITVTRVGGKANKYQGQAVVTIHNTEGGVVAGTLVSGHFSGPSSDAVSGTTGADGSVTLLSSPVKSPVGVWCFTVDDVSRGSDIYDPGLNVETSDCEAVAKMMTTAMPTEYELGQNHPNPFNPGTAIHFALPHSSHVSLEIYNIMGQKVATLVDERLEAGYHTVSWDAGNMASGLYLYRIRADQFVDTKKMVLLK